MTKNKMLVALAAFTLVLNGCKGKTGPSGPAGTNGSDAPAKGYTSVFQTGVSPSSAYSGTTINRLDSLNSTNNYHDAYLYCSSGAGEVSAVLLKFDLSGYIPVNATILSADVELVSSSSTTVGGPVTVGVHAMKTSGCNWTTSATWNKYDGWGAWNGCGNDTIFNAGTYNATLSACVIPVSYNNTVQKIGFSIPASVITDWLTNNNNGLAVVSEHMGSDTTGLAVFASPTDTNVSYRPTLKVNYSL